MKIRSLLEWMSAMLAAILILVWSGPVGAQTAGAAALTGEVRSAEEGPMEGVFVNAPNAASTVTVTV